MHKALFLRDTNADLVNVGAQILYINNITRIYEQNKCF